MLFENNIGSCSASNSTNVVSFQPINFSSFDFSVNSNNQLLKNCSTSVCKSDDSKIVQNFHVKNSQGNSQYYQSENLSGAIVPLTKNFLNTNPKETDIKAIESYSTLDVLKIVGKQQNNNLIDLVPSTLSEINKKPQICEKSSVLEEFDPLVEYDSIKKNDLSHIAKSSESKDNCSETVIYNDNYSRHETDGVSKELDDVDEEDFNDAQSACSENFYDPFDPFEYMNSSSYDGSLGEPIYTTVNQSIKVSSKLSENCLTRKSMLESEVCFFLFLH